MVGSRTAVGQVQRGAGWQYMAFTGPPGLLVLHSFFRLLLLRGQTSLCYSRSTRKNRAEGGQETRQGASTSSFFHCTSASAGRAHQNRDSMATQFARTQAQQRVGGSSSSRRAAFTSARPAVQQRRSSVQVRADGAAAAPAAAPGIEKTSTAFKPVLDIEAIKGVLPHRYFLFRRY